MVNKSTFQLTIDELEIDNTLKLRNLRMELSSDREATAEEQLALLEKLPQALTSIKEAIQEAQK